MKTTLALALEALAAVAAARSALREAERAFNTLDLNSIIDPEPLLVAMAGAR